MGALAVLLLAAAFDGEAALRHAAAPGSPGPHPWGSPRARAAAAYVSAQLHQAGVSDVHFEEFELKGVRGVNVVGSVRGTGRGTVIVGAHHDTAPDAPGAYDDGGGVGVLIELARALAHGPAPPRTVLFASFDGEEAWSTGHGTLAGSRAFVRGLGAGARDVTAAIIVEMCGWRGGTPVLHPIAYADPLRPGRHVVAPGWLVSAALSGARASGAPLGVGDPWLSWVYQPAVRTFRIGLYGDDLALLQAGVPSVFASDSSFAAYYPWYHQATDTADRLDAVSLARMGEAMRGALDAVLRAPALRDPDPDWFAVFGRVLPRPALLALGAIAIAPGLVYAWSLGGLGLLARLVQAGLFAALLWDEPVPALWVLFAPVLASGLSRRRVVLALSLLPAVAMVVLGTAAWSRGMAHGTWLPAWQIGAALGVLALSVVPVAPSRGRAAKNGARPSRRGRAGLPRARGAA
jgi:peptidase M28-like protein